MIKSIKKKLQISKNGVMSQSNRFGLIKKEMLWFVSADVPSILTIGMTIKNYLILKSSTQSKFLNLTMLQPFHLTSILKMIATLK